jgi:hypothetical protein
LAVKKIIKKVSAYPFVGTLMHGTHPIPVSIVRLTMQGLLAEIAQTSLQPGERFDLTFELPVLHHVVMEKVMVVKFYSRWSGPAQSASSQSSSQSSFGEAATKTGRSRNDARSVESGSAHKSSHYGQSAHKQSTDGHSAQSESHGSVGHLVELHFTSLSELGRDCVAQWLSELARTAK